MQAFVDRWCVLGVTVLLFCGCASPAPLPPKASALNRAGAEALAEGDLDLAEARLSVALEYNPSFVEALTNLGVVEAQRGNFARARELLERARRVNPDIAQPHHGLGVLSEREGRKDRAARHYQDALRVDPGFPASRANYARLLFDAGMIEHARIQFQRLTEVAPEDSAGYAGLAEALLRLQRRAEADAVVARGLRAAPTHGGLQVLEARRLIRTGEIPAAIALLEPLTKAETDDSVAALSWLAVAELLRSRPERALAAAERAAHLDSSDPLVVHVVASVLSELGDPRAAPWRTRARQLARLHGAGGSTE